jgi:uncharacterized protein (TIRG00374 family)
MTVDEAASAEAFEHDFDEAEAAMEAGGLGRLLTPRALFFIGLGIVGAIVALYVLLPKLVGAEAVMKKIGDANWPWIVVAFGFITVAIAAYGLAFKAVIAGGDNPPEISERFDFKTTYQITVSGYAGAALFSAAGAGGLAIVYWALRKLGMEARRSACRIVALLVLLYSFYAISVIVFGILLRTGVLSGSNPVGGTIVPAAVAGVAIVIVLLIALIPGDVERRLGVLQNSSRWARIARRLATIPGTVATGVRTAIDRLRDRRTALLALTGATLYWAGAIGVLWASFHAYGVKVPFGVVVQGFFVGMAANIIPSPAAGAGPVDAGMIAAFLLFDIPKESVFPAVLTYRFIAFWFPVIPGVVAYLQLRRTVRRWEAEDTQDYTSVSKALEAT